MGYDQGAGKSKARRFPLSSKLHQFRALFTAVSALHAVWGTVLPPEGESATAFESQLIAHSASAHTPMLAVQGAARTVYVRRLESAEHHTSSKRVHVRAIAREDQCEAFLIQGDEASLPAPRYKPAGTSLGEAKELFVAVPLESRSFHSALESQSE